MDIDKRIAESEQKFEQQKARREEYQRLAEESLIEMNKLQGEWRLLQELKADKPKKVNKKADTIVVPEEAK